MAITSVLCPVIRSHVSIVTNLEGTVTLVICPEYLAAGVCRVQSEARRGGLLSQLLERLDEGTLERHSTRCLFSV